MYIVYSNQLKYKYMYIQIHVHTNTCTCTCTYWTDVVYVQYMYVHKSN